MNGDFNYGYIIPGHGAKGHQQPINNSNDLKSMYEKRKQIIMWLKVTQGKKPVKCPLYSRVFKEVRTEKVGGCSTSHDSHLQKMSVVQIIVDKLADIHFEYMPLIILSSSKEAFFQV